MSLAFWLDRPESGDRVASVKSTWQIQEAKNHFSRVVAGAITHGVQTVTKHGKPVVVVVSAEAYRKSLPRRRVVDVLRECPEPGLDVVPVRDTPRALGL